MLQRLLSLTLLALTITFQASCPPVQIAASPPAADPATPSPSVSDHAWRDTFRWKNRLILLFAPTPDHPALTATQAVLEVHPDQVSDRRLLPNEVVGPGPVDELPVDGRALRTALDVPSDPFTAVLIGLDGTEKARTHHAVDVEAWFARIDAMPMRRRELRARAAPSPASDTDGS